MMTCNHFTTDLPWQDILNAPPPNHDQDLVPALIIRSNQVFLMLMHLIHQIMTVMTYRTTLWMLLCIIPIVLVNHTLRTNPPTILMRTTTAPTSTSRMISLTFCVLYMISPPNLTTSLTRSQP